MGKDWGGWGEDTGDLVFDRAVPSSKWKLNGRLGLQREGNGWQPRASGQRGRRIRRSRTRNLACIKVPSRQAVFRLYCDNQQALR
jgi:hypothetical protein